MTTHSVTLLRCAIPALSAAAFVAAACSGDALTPTAPSGVPAAPGLTAAGPDVSLFLSGALARGVTTEPCTLSGGTATTCYRITVAGLPVDHAVGPFCPPTTSSTAAQGGIWFDGAGLYDVDGEFITGLASLYGDDNWRLYDENGNVNVTNTREAFEGAARPNVAPEYRNHCVEGRVAWLPGGQPVTTTVLIPTRPVAAAAPTSNARFLGVTLNGVRIDGSAPVRDILSAYTIAAFDDCGGHFNPFEGYHVHAAMGCSGVEVAGHGRHFAYALDGYALFTPVAAANDLDRCGGHDSDLLGYHYHAAPAAENLVVRCFTGEIARQ